MRTICTEENSVMLFSLDNKIIDAALNGILKEFISRTHLTDGIKVKDVIYPEINTDVISVHELSQFDRNDYEHIYNKGLCPLLLRENVKYAKVRVINEEVDGYVVYEIVSRRFVLEIDQEGVPYIYDKNGYSEVENPDGLYCNWNIEYQLGKVVEQYLPKPQKMRPLTFVKRFDEVTRIYKSLSGNPSKRQAKSLLNKIDTLIDYVYNLEYELENMKTDLEYFE